MNLFTGLESPEMNETALLEAELQVEKDRHHALKQKMHTVETKQCDADAAHAEAMLDAFNDDSLSAA